MDVQQRRRRLGTPFVDEQAGPVDLHYPLPRY
jgi:hypothetical protein